MRRIATRNGVAAHVAAPPRRKASITMAEYLAGHDGEPPACETSLRFGLGVLVLLAIVLTLLVAAFSETPQASSSSVDRDDASTTAGGLEAAAGSNRGQG